MELVRIFRNPNMLINPKPKSNENEVQGQKSPSTEKEFRRKKSCNLPTGLLGGKSEALPSDEGIKKRGLADVRAPDEGDLGEAVGGAVLCTDAALHELGGGYLGVPRVGAEHDIRPFEHSPEDRVRRPLR